MAWLPAGWRAASPQMISLARTGDFLIAGLALSAHRNIQNTSFYSLQGYWKQ